jgi:methylated-DNA-protein-cysteine methyltransferase-like protein
LARSRKSIADLFLPHGGRRPKATRPPAPADSPEIQEIWSVVGSIPRGQVSTYGAVARAAGLPGRARLAGRALKLCELNLPWHRVVGAGGRIVFPRSSAQHREQARRLRAEGVPVKEGRVSRERITDLV